MLLVHKISILVFQILISSYTVEYTPQAYIPSDIDNFAKMYEPLLVGSRPKLVSIDGGQYKFILIFSIKVTSIYTTILGVVQTSKRNFGYNGESNLDLQYGMALVSPSQEVSLYQVGDNVIG